MATIEIVEGGPEALRALLRGQGEGQLIAQQITQQGAMHALTTLLEHGCTAELARGMLASLRQNMKVIDEVAAERGIACLFAEGVTAQPLQGGLTNDELRAAFRRKLPAVEPTEHDLTVFALGVEVGADDAINAKRYRWLRAQHWNEAPMCVIVRPKDAVKLGHDCPALERLDELVDQAMTDAHQG